MMDVAREVARNEICVVDFIRKRIDEKPRHVSFYGRSCLEEYSSNAKVRSCLLRNWWGTPSLVSNVIRNWTFLRVLVLKQKNLDSLPDSLGKLVHLRHLDISDNGDLETLPKSITKLHNLQTLLLSGCRHLKELPHDLSKLVNLRVLDILGCSLGHMPRGMDKLSYLHTLTEFQVGESSSSSGPSVVEQLQGLKGLINLKGKLEIEFWISKNGAYVAKEKSNQGGGYLRNQQHLSEIVVEFKLYEKADGRADYEEALLEDLVPHPNLTSFRLLFYHGMRMPSWITFLPNICLIDIRSCGELRCLQPLGKLPNLRVLHLRGLWNLKYIEEEETSSSRGSSEKKAWLTESFFPSLEKLHLQDLPKLKGWWRGVKCAEQNQQKHDQLLLCHQHDSDSSSNNSIPFLFLPSFPRLSYLHIESCPELTCMPLCPTINRLHLEKFNKRLKIMSCTRREAGDPISSVSQCLTEIKLSCSGEVESLRELGEFFKTCCSSSLRYLTILFYDNLTSLRGLEHLTSLETLSILFARNLSLSEEENRDEDDDGSMPWRSLHRSLRSLRFFDLPKLVNLPKGIQFLSSLEFLRIESCHALESLPQWMPKLTSLNRLELINCSKGLAQRCQKTPPGEDWFYIQHIPNIKVTTPVSEPFDLDAYF